jgi:hypothetical protein
MASASAVASGAPAVPALEQELLTYEEASSGGEVPKGRVVCSRSREQLNS